MILYSYPLQAIIVGTASCKLSLSKAYQELEEDNKAILILESALEFTEKDWDFINSFKELPNQTNPYQINEELWASYFHRFLPQNKDKSLTKISRTNSDFGASSSFSMWELWSKRSGEMTHPIYPPALIQKMNQINLKIQTIIEKYAGYQLEAQRFTHNRMLPGDYLQRHSDSAEPGSPFEHRVFTATLMGNAKFEGANFNLYSKSLFNRSTDSFDHSNQIIKFKSPERSLFIMLGSRDHSVDILRSGQRDLFAFFYYPKK